MEKIKTFSTVRKSLNTHGTLSVYLLCRLITVSCFQKNRFGEIVNSGSQSNSKVQSTLRQIHETSIGTSIVRKKDNQGIPPLERRGGTGITASEIEQARFVTGNYNFETGSLTGILDHSKWESLKKRRRDSRLILLYKGLKGKASIPTDDLIPLARRCRNDHSMANQVPIANTNIYKCSFFSQTIRDWNHFRTLLSLLLKMPRMVLQSSLLW